MKLPFAHYVKAHHISRAALCVGVLVAAIVFFVVGAGIRLLVGPVSLGPLAGPLADAIQGALPGITLKYDQAAIEWSRDEGRINLVVLGARILDQNNIVVAEAPKADIDLAAAPFLKGQFVVKRITLVGVRLSLVHMKEGGIRLGSESDKSQDNILQRLNDVIEAKGSSTSSLQSFAVRDAHIAVFDEITGLSMVAPKASLALTAKTGAIGASFESDVTISGRVAHVQADLTLPPDKGPVDGDVTVTHLDLRALGAAPMFKPLANVALLTDLAMKFSVAAGGHLTRADFDLGATGDVPLALLKDKMLHVRRLRLTGDYDGIKNHIALDNVSLDSKEAILKLKAGGDLHYDGQGDVQSIDTAVTTGTIALDMPGIFQQPVGFSSLQLRGTWQAARQFDIQKFTLAAPALALDVKGSVTLGDKGQAPGLAVAGSLKPMAVDAMLRYWPLTAEAGTREWIAGNIFAGTLGPLTFETHFPVGLMDQPILPDASMKLDFPFSGIEGNYVRGLTRVTGVSGKATLLGDTFTADFSGGHVGAIAVRDGHALIPTLHVVGTVGVFSAHADGTMGDIMTLIDMKPLNYPTRFGIDPAQTKGEASVDMSFKVPMLANLPVDDVGISVKAAVSDFAVVLGKTHLTNGTVNFDIDDDHLHQTGIVQLADTRLNVDWVEDFKTTQPITTRLNVKGPLTEGARTALNVGMATILTGTIPINADIQGHRGALRTADVSMDLTQAAIAIPFINLGKPAGAGASGHVVINFGPGDTLHDETIHLGGPSLLANGTAQFSPDGALTVLSFPSLKMGALNDLSLTLARNAAGDDYTLRGHSLDGSMIGRNGAGGVPGAPGAPGAVPAHEDTVTGPFHIDARLDRFAMRDNVAIAPFNLDMSGVGNRLGTLTLSGSLSKTATITGTLDNVPGGRKVTMVAGDSGLLLRGLFAFESMRGGRMTVEATLPGRASDAEVPSAAPDYQGTLSIADFTMLHQPLLTRLFSAGSLTGVGDLMGGDGISIEELDVPFQSKNNVISIHDARARGRAIGATADGYIDRPKNQLALKGSLIPAYGLNSVLGNIPLLGDVLVSKKGEGVFGATYSATGNADQPNISVNPASMLTPGILRRIWEGHIPTSANAPSNAPQTAQTTPPADTGLKPN